MFHDFLEHLDNLPIEERTRVNAQWDELLKDKKKTKVIKKKNERPIPNIRSRR